MIGERERERERERLYGRRICTGPARCSSSLAPTNSIAGEKLSVPPPCLVHCSSSPGDRNGVIETQSGIWPVSCSVWALETRWQGCGQFFDQFLVFSMISLRFFLVSSGFVETRWLGWQFLNGDRNNAGRLGAGFISSFSVCLETRWLSQKRGFYLPDYYCGIWLHVVL